MRRVLDDHQLVRLGQREQRVEVRGMSVQVHRNDGLRARRDLRLDLCDVHHVRGGIDIDKHRRSAAVANRGRGGDECIGDRDDFRSRPHSGSQQRQVQRAGARVYAYTMTGVAVGSKLLFELRDFAAQNVLG